MAPLDSIGQLSRGPHKVKFLLWVMPDKGARTLKSSKNVAMSCYRHFLDDFESPEPLSGRTKSEIFTLCSPWRLGLCCQGVPFGISQELKHQDFFKKIVVAYVLLFETFYYINFKWPVLLFPWWYTKYMGIFLIKGSNYIT